MKRLITAAVLVPLLWYAIKRASLTVFAAAVVAIAVGAAWECYRMLAARGARPFAWLGMAATGLVTWSFCGLPALPAEVALVGLTLATAVLAMWSRPDPRSMLDATMATMLAPLMVGLTLGYLLALRAVPGELGSDLVMLTLACVMFSDTAAYYVGKNYGRRRMAPNLSPKKSWEGAIGGFGGSVLGALVAHAWFYQALPLPHAIGVGLVLAPAGILGDLAESMIKRATGVKDSSSLIPGHGGLLDRTDSILFAAPVMYLYFKLFLEAAA